MSDTLRTMLREAGCRLPAAAPAVAETISTKVAFGEFWEYNEFELAMERLEGLGESYKMPARFWCLLLACAKIMKLQPSAAYYERQITACQLVEVGSGRFI